MDGIRPGLTQQQEIRDCCAHIFTSQHPGSTCCTGWAEHVQSRKNTPDSSTRTGTRLNVYINDSWCSNAVEVDGQCLPNVKFLVLGCWPQYLPRDLMSQNDYLPSSGCPDEGKYASQVLYEVISSHMKNNQMECLF